MSRRQSSFLFALGLAIALAAAYWIRAPGYMDSEYYFATGKEIASGRGFVETFLWNYLDDPHGLPHPSHLYWMPLTSILAAGGMRVFGLAFRAAQLPFLLLTAGLPWLAARISLRWKTEGARPMLTGILAAFPGFFLPFLVTTDAFALFAWLGAGALLMMWAASERESVCLWVASGALVALAHLTRADGILLFVPALIILLPLHRRRWLELLAFVAGYLVVMLPWFLRNWAVAGSLLGAGTLRTLWLTTYDELFSFPATGLTFSHWWASGLLAILVARWHALWTNVASLLLVNGMVILAPLATLAAYRLRRDGVVRTVATYWGTLFAAMTLVFPFAGARGGYFHSSAAVMPFLWALAPIGLADAVRWLRTRLGWRDGGFAVWQGIAVAICAATSVWVMGSRAIGPRPGSPVWQSAEDSYTSVGRRLAAVDPPARLVAVNDPPGFYVASGIPAVVVPDGGVDRLRQVVQVFQVDWIVLDANRPVGLADLYDRPSSLAWLALAGQEADSLGRPIYLLRVVEQAGTP